MACRPPWLPPGLRLPPRRVGGRSNPAYAAAYWRLRYRHDPAFRAAEDARSRAQKRAAALERAAGRRWRERWARRSMARLRAAGWTRARVGAALGVSGDAASAWATGRWRPSEANAAALARLADRAEGGGGR